MMSVQVMDDVCLLLQVGTEDQDLTIIPRLSSGWNKVAEAVDYARLMFRFSAQIKTVFNAAGESTKCVFGLDYGSRHWFFQYF